MSFDIEGHERKRRRASRAATEYCKPFADAAIIQLSMGSWMGGYNLVKPAVVAPASLIFASAFLGLSAYLGNEYVKCTRHKQKELMSVK
jgi:hypothetical protein